MIERLQGRIGLSVFWLKIIALLTMFIDHIGAVLFPDEILFRIIGRISFPIFAFLIVEGFMHTSNVKKYMVRLLIFAFVAEIPYDLAFRGNVIDFEKQNIFFTLLLGVILLYILTEFKNALLHIVATFLLFLAAGLLKSDYGATGLLFILCFFVLQNKRIYAVIVISGINVFLLGPVQAYGALGTIPILLYNGKLGRKMKWFFYISYPAHLLILYLIKTYWWEK